MDRFSIGTDRMTIRVVTPEDWTQIHLFEQENLEHQAKWEPLREPKYHHPSTCQNRVKQRHSEYMQGSLLPLAGFNRADSQIVALATFSQIVRGPFQACYLGYAVHCQYEGLGIMIEMLKPSIHYVFSQLRLNRIMANYLPENQRSARLLARLGFEVEGLAKSYLQINGKWQDHVLSAKLNPLTMPPNKVDRDLPFIVVGLKVNPQWVGRESDVF